jgi:hypothetical protein
MKSVLVAKGVIYQLTGRQASADALGPMLLDKIEVWARKNPNRERLVF